MTSILQPKRIIGTKIINPIQDIYQLNNFLNNLQGYDCEVIKVSCYLPNRELFEPVVIEYSNKYNIILDLTWARYTASKDLDNMIYIKNVDSKNPDFKVGGITLTRGYFERI